MPRYYLPKVNKFVTFAASLPIALSGGVGYCFGLWSPLLKANYNLSQGSLGLVAAAHNLGAYSSFISGILYDSLEHRHHVGPRLSLLIGALMNCVGFSMLWAAVTKRIEVALWQMILLAMVAGNGGTWYDTSPLATNLRNFPASRGIVVGIIKSCIGLSSSLYTEAFEGFFGGHAGPFLLFLAWAPSTVALVLLPLVNYVHYVQSSETHKTFTTDQRFYVALRIIAALSVYLMITALVSGLTDVSHHMKVWFAIGAIMLMIPVVAISYDSGGLYAEKASLFYDEEEEGEEYLLPSEARLPHHTQGGAHDCDVSVDGTDVMDDDSPLITRDKSMEHIFPSLSIAECFVSTDFWIMAFVCGIGIGCGLAFLNNSSQLVTSLGGSSAMKSILVTFFGVASCAGRLLFGAIPEQMLHKHGLPRPFFLVFAAGCGCLTYAATAFANPLLLYPLSLLAGLWFGGHWSLLPSLASELFGLENFASIYTILQMAPAIAGYLLGAYLLGGTYDAVGKRHGDPGNTCIGSDCFRSAFLIVSLLGLVSTLLSFWLLKKTFKQYRAGYGALRVFERDVDDADSIPPS
ncbi:hypothetical protein M9435_000236 [Picochlorum sp. BPE23]|nr:hypothetical protein M9435_000236 [Picochlorum sp. BPE23]